MAESTSYLLAGSLQSDYIDGHGNLVHHWWGDNQWVTEVLTGPDSHGPVRDAADPGAGINWIQNAYDTDGRIDLFAVTEDGSAQIHAYYAPAWGWNADLLPGVGGRGDVAVVATGGPDGADTADGI